MSERERSGECSERLTLVGHDEVASAQRHAVSSGPVAGHVHQQPVQPVTVGRLAGAGLIGVDRQHCSSIAARARWSTVSTSERLLGVRKQELWQLLLTCVVVEQPGVVRPPHSLGLILHAVEVQMHAGWMHASLAVVLHLTHKRTQRRAERHAQ